jgi:hypothetical protein
LGGELVEADQTVTDSELEGDMCRAKIQAEQSSTEEMKKEGRHKGMGGGK